MKWTKNKIMLLLLALALLLGALVWGGRYGNSNAKIESLVYTQTPTSSVADETTALSSETKEAEPAISSAENSAAIAEGSTVASPESTQPPTAEEEAGRTGVESPLESSQIQSSSQEDPSHLILAGNKEYSEKKGMVIDKKTGKDKYLTDPVPEGKPLPVEWQEAAIDTTVQQHCTLSVSCRSILNNMDIFNKDKMEVLPKDGIIFKPQKVVFYKGESVFNVLQREMKKNKIHMEFVMTPMYNSVYVEGIHNLYEFDTGELSGWMYKVNNWFPNYGASRYQLQDGDVIEWEYTCDLGRDVGGYYALGGEAELPAAKKKALEERIKAEEKAKQEKNQGSQTASPGVETKKP